MKDTKNNFLVPAAIIIAGALIAGGIYFGGGARGTSNQAQGPNGPSAEELAKNAKPISSDDHSIGNPATASVVIIEYSDLECPFCKTFHTTMQKLMDTYKDGGKVAWVYRHFPLNIHPKAATEALATECVASLAGNDAFWQYTNRIFEITPSNNQLDLAELPKLAKEVGVDPTKFDACMKAATYKQKIDASTQDAVNAGGDGTPFSIIISKKGDVIPLVGAYPFEDVKQIIDSLLAKK
ncbi:MAG: DsbA family protein [Candidatus Roizmanbacteria bacterium]|nr:DsbA family protein [Candidatus Roizmanbacteria bacterium]